MLQLYNTLSKKKELISTLTSKHIGLYVCGMTVYDHCHLGHARVWVAFDILVRYLTHLGYTVNYTRNITDIDDKIIQRASDNQESISSLTQRMIRSMHQDMAALQLLPPTHEPCATHHISQMVTLIKILIQKGYAYVSDSGDVYYSVNQFKCYGQLAQQDLSTLIAGARVAVDTQKKHPLDFVLWKKIATQDPIGWDSPWGRGRPGWHLECSTMALEYLGKSFDIHGGGADLAFPHHQNEVAQSEAVTGQTFVKTWMHVGFVQINDTKMSKSAGNALNLKTLIKKYSGEVIRYFLLTSYYRYPIIYREEHLHKAQKGLERLYKATQYTKQSSIPLQTPVLFEYEKQFHKALLDDLNTPMALAVLFDIARDVNRLKDSKEGILLSHLLKRLGGLLGLLQQDKLPTIDKSPCLDHQWIDEAVEKRQIARQQKAWQLADQIRQSLFDKGIRIEDTIEGTKWHYIDSDSSP